MRPLHYMQRKLLALSGPGSISASPRCRTKLGQLLKCRSTDHLWCLVLACFNLNDLLIVGSGLICAASVATMIRLVRPSSGSGIYDVKLKLE